MIKGISASSLIQKEKKNIMRGRKNKARKELNKYIFQDVLSQKLQDIQNGNFK